LYIFQGCHYIFRSTMTCCRLRCIQHRYRKTTCHDKLSTIRIFFLSSIHDNVWNFFNRMNTNTMCSPGTSMPHYGRRERTCKHTHPCLVFPPGWLVIPVSSLLMPDQNAERLSRLLPDLYPNSLLSLNDGPGNITITTAAS
jgi:hypothetical protein